MKRILKDPFVHFLAAGAFIFALYSVSPMQQRADAPRRIVIDAATQEWMYRNFEKQFGRPPSRAEMERLIEAEIEHEVKYREALALGLDERDTVVRRRMMQKFDFLFDDAASAAVPDDATLETWYAEHAGEFALPDRVSFRHVWFSPDRRGADAKHDATAALAKVADDGAPQGDPFPLQSAFEHATYEEVRTAFGPEFADAVFAAPPGEWIGPVESGLGHHLLLVDERIEGQTPKLDAVRNEAIARWREERTAQLRERLIENLIADYDVEVDETALDRFQFVPERGRLAP